MNARKYVYRAGLIPYHVDDTGTIKMGFIVPNDPKNWWGGEVPQLCKGKIDDGETALEAAERELLEEMGMERNNIATPQELGIFLTRMTIFVAECLDPTKFVDPTTPHEVKGRMWLSLEEFEAMGRPLHVGIVRLAHSTIQHMLAKDTHDSIPHKFI